MPLLESVDLCKHYVSVESGEDLVVLDHLSFSLEIGASLAIVGPSGCGKSTLLNIIGALDRPSSGRLTFRGEDLAAMDEAALAAFRNREIGLVFQDHHLLPQLSVLENVLLPTLVRGAPASGAEQRADALLERVGLTERRAHRPAELSGGERQRVAVVRALINQPGLLLADEPTGALDAAAAANLADLLVDLNREQKVALITVTHSAQLAERMGRLCELRNGGLEEISTG